MAFFERDSGEGARDRVRFRMRTSEECFMRLARSMAISFAFGSLGFWRVIFSCGPETGRIRRKA